MIKEEKQRWQKRGGEELMYAFSNIGANSIVFDIGLWKGGWSKEIAKRFDPYIYGFEPVDRYYQIATRVLAGYPKVNLSNFGLGKESGQFKIFSKRAGTSLIGDGGSTKTVEIKCIKDVMPEGTVDLAAINIEGAEYELLEYMLDTALIERFGLLLIQFHESFPGHKDRREAIRARLGVTHETIYCYDTVWELWRKK